MADTKDRMNIDEDPKFKKFLDSDQYPRDLKLMHSILKGMSVTDYDPKVPQQMYEFMHRFVTDMLQDAEDYREFAGKSQIEVMDLKLAYQTRTTNAQNMPPQRMTLLEMARKKNNVPLPMPEEGKYTVQLPPLEWQLTEPNYQIHPRSLVAEEEEEANGDAMAVDQPVQTPSQGLQPTQLNFNQAAGVPPRQ